MSEESFNASTANRERSGTPLPRLGFLGVGWIGRHRLEAIARSGLAEIAALADASPEALAQAAIVAPEAVRAESLEALLEQEIDGLVIATPSALHAEQAISALLRGIAVFCQKPLGRNAGETQRVVTAARDADRLLGVDLSYRFLSGMQRLATLIREGELGEIFAINAVFHNAYGPDKAWFYDPRLAGGGCVMDLGIHLVDLALWALEFPPVIDCESRLYAGGQPLLSRAERVEDFASALLTLSNGAVLQLACSWCLAAGCDAVISMEFYGTHGGAALRNLNGSFHDFVAERYQGTEKNILCQPPEDWGGRAAVDWVRRLAAGEGFDPQSWHLTQVAAVLDQIYGLAH